MLNAFLGRCGRIVPRLLFVWGCALVVCAASTIANAGGTILDAGFEPPDYTLGQLQGQSGWLTTGNSTSTATVQNSVVHSGSQAVLVSRTANSDRRWAVPKSGFPTEPTGFITVDWDMRVAGPAGTPGSGQFGPFFGVETYDADSGIFVLGSLGVDATTGEVLYQEQDTGYLVPTGNIVAFNDWNHYRLVLDFMMDTYHVYMNGAFLAATGFVDRGFDLNNFTDADIAAFAAAADPISQGLAGSAVVDNFVIRDIQSGDYDLDGDEDNADYLLWRATFGTTVPVPGAGADGNRNGIVDAADYVVWRNNAGASLGAGAEAGLASFVVPEPGTFLLALVSVAALAVTRRNMLRR